MLNPPFEFAADDRFFYSRSFAQRVVVFAKTHKIYDKTATTTSFNALIDLLLVLVACQPRLPPYVLLEILQLLPEFDWLSTTELLQPTIKIDKFYQKLKN